MPNDIFSWSEAVDVVKNTIFFSAPSGSRNPYVPKEFVALAIQVGRMKFDGYTQDIDFSNNRKRFVGKINIQHNSGWTTRLDLMQDGLIPVYFDFLDHGECLLVYVDGGILKNLKEL
jgi:hypothetical protein